MYLTFAEYVEMGGTALEQEITPKLETASENVDALTFYRINRKGFEHLTEFQQAQIKKACLYQADFLYDNQDAVETALEHYSINGVTMKFGNSALYEIIDGVAISNKAMSLLRSTGLTSRMAMYHEVQPCFIRDL